MNVDTFGDPNKFPIINIIAERINLLPKNQKKYFSKFIGRFNEMCSYLNKGQPSYIKEYILHLIKTEQTSTLTSLKEKGIDPVLISHLNCFVHTKIKILIKENKIELDKKIIFKKVVFEEDE
jgi:hypothetical protein